MQTAPEVIFKDLDRSLWVEEYIAQRCTHLEKFSDEITLPMFEPAEKP